MKIIFAHPAAIGRGTFVRSMGSIVPPAVAIPEIRKAIGITAARLAALLFVSTRTVEGWEQGRRISLKNLVSLRTLIDSHAKLKRL